MKKFNEWWNRVNPEWKEFTIWQKLFGEHGGGVFLWVILFLFVLGTCSSCVTVKEDKQDYKYIWDVVVTYQNGDIDTVHHEMNSHGGYDVDLYIQTTKHVPGSIGNTQVPACLVSQCMYKTITICCGVRKIDTLDFQKIPIIIETSSQ